MVGRWIFPISSLCLSMACHSPHSRDSCHAILPDHRENGEVFLNRSANGAENRTGCRKFRINQTGMHCLPRDDTKG